MIADWLKNRRELEHQKRIDPNKQKHSNAQSDWLKFLTLKTGRYGLSETE